MKANRSSLIIFLIFFCIVSSCRDEGKIKNVNKNVFEIDVRGALGEKEKEHFISDLKRKIEYIPLETNDSCMLISVSNIYLYRDNIYISDSQVLYQFKIIEDENYIFLTLQEGLAPGKWDFKYFLYNKKSGNIDLTSGFTDNIDGGITFWPQFSYCYKIPLFIDL